MPDKVLTRALYKLICRVPRAIYSVQDACSILKKARVSSAEECGEIIRQMNSPPELFRAIAEHTIHSNILRDAMTNYERSLAILEEEFERAMGLARNDVLNQGFKLDFR